MGALDKEPVSSAIWKEIARTHHNENIRLKKEKARYKQAFYFYAIFFYALASVLLYHFYIYH